MTPGHPRWEEFCTRLAALLIMDGCSGELATASATLWAMGYTMPDIRAALRYFAEHGGHCDCEVLYNVDACAVDRCVQKLEPRA